MISNETKTSFQSHGYVLLCNEERQHWFFSFFTLALQFPSSLPRQGIRLLAMRTDISKMNSPNADAMETSRSETETFICIQIYIYDIVADFYRRHLCTSIALGMNKTWTEYRQWFLWSILFWKQKLVFFSFAAHMKHLCTVYVLWCSVHLCHCRSLDLPEAYHILTARDTLTVSNSFRFYFQFFSLCLHHRIKSFLFWFMNWVIFIYWYAWCIVYDVRTMSIITIEFLFLLFFFGFASSSLLHMFMCVFIKIGKNPTKMAKVVTFSNWNFTSYR